MSPNVHRDTRFKQDTVVHTVTGLGAFLYDTDGHHIGPGYSGAQTYLGFLTQGPEETRG